MIRELAFFLLMGCLIVAAPCKADDDDFTTPASYLWQQEQIDSNPSNLDSGIQQQKSTDDLQQRQQQAIGPFGANNNNLRPNQFQQGEMLSQGNNNDPFGNNFPFGNNNPFGGNNGAFGMRPPPPFGGGPSGRGPPFGRGPPPPPCFGQMFGQGGFNPMNPSQHQQQPLRGLQGLDGQSSEQPRQKLDNQSAPNQLSNSSSPQGLE